MDMVVKYIKQLDFISFVKAKECIYIDAQDYYNLKDSLDYSLVLANDNLLNYMTMSTYNILLKNLWLHYIIVDNVFSDLSSKYSIEGNGLIVTSVSNAGASTSVQSLRALDEGNLITIDLFRTPYGRRAYAILDSVTPLAIIG